MARAGTVPRRSDLLHCRVSDLQGKPAKCQNRVNLPAGFTAAGETRDFTKQDYPDVSGNHCRLPAGFQGARFPEGRLIGGGAQIMLYTSKFCINSGHSLFRRRLRGPIRAPRSIFLELPTLKARKSCVQSKDTDMRSVSYPHPFYRVAAAFGDARRGTSMVPLSGLGLRTFGFLRDSEPCVDSQFSSGSP